ncbi:MAG: ArsA family ATPase [Deltaproteobacteria bacterium]|nr:ArsA family ATPase [Deltaproteobacteria bacterium]
MKDFATVLDSHRILVCVGSGGVGKTTTSAALAVWGALHGRRTAVVTIDPAKRLADCLGLTLSHTEATPISTEVFARAGLTPTGTLTALMVDQQSAWDATVAKYAPTPEARDRILANRFYQGLSQTFAGSHEYMALNTLATLVYSDAYDLIVLDTPPVRQALDFLEAPARLQRFLDSKLSRWFMRPVVERGWAAFSFANQTTAMLLRKIEEATGISTLGEVAEFFTAMRGMFEDFEVRFSRVSALLASEDTAFLLVTSPEAAVLKEAEGFRAGLERMEIALKGVIVNRVHEQWQATQAQTLDTKQITTQMRRRFPQVEAGDIRWMVKNFLAYQELAKSEALRLQDFHRELSSSVPVVAIPLLHESLADLQGLTALHRYFVSEKRLKTA